MNILFLNWKDLKNPEVGGAEIIIYELAKRFVSDGHNVTWFSRTFKNAKTEETYDNIKIIRKGNVLTTYVHAYLYYRSLIKKPDIVIDCVNTIAWQTPLYVPKNKRITLINQLARQAFFYEMPFPLSFIGYCLEPLQFATYKNTSITCYSLSVKRDIEQLGIDNKNISTFHLGIDHDRYKPKNKSKSPLFIFVARLVKVKRADLCVKAFQILVSKYPSAQLVIVGFGPQEEYIRTLIEKYKLQSSVQIVSKNALYFSGSKQDLKVHFMQKAWSLILPSVKEGWGMVVTEAAACGTPSIVTNVTGLSDSVVSNVTGLIISNNPTEYELFLSMERIILDQKFRQKSSREAIKRSKSYNWRNTYVEFNSILQKKIAE